MNARRSSASQFDFSQPHVLRRNDIRPLHGAMINGIWRGAGAVYPVRAPEKTSGPDVWSEVLQPGWSISWTTLPNHEILDSHYHPVISYVAIVKGRAQLIGQQTGFVDAGSIIRIPAWHLHGLLFAGRFLTRLALRFTPFLSSRCTSCMRFSEGILGATFRCRAFCVWSPKVRSFPISVNRRAES